MSDPTPDEPTSEAEDAGTNVEESPNDSSPSNRKWFLAIAAVTVLAVGIAGIGLATTSEEETATSEASVASDIGGTLLKGLTSDFVKKNVVGGVVSGGVGFVVSLGLKSIISELGGTTETAEGIETLKTVKEINDKLDAVSIQLTAIESHLSEISVTMAEIERTVVLGNLEARNEVVNKAIGEIRDSYVAYTALVCAQGVEAERKLNIDSKGSVYNQRNCSDTVANYKRTFLNTYATATSSRFELLHKQVMQSGTSPSILADFANVYVGNRKYFGYKDSIAMRNFYTNIAEYEALDVFLQSERYQMQGQEGDAEAVLTNWYNNDRAEQSVIPPLLPQGIVISLPNGVGPVGAAYPSLMLTPPMWMSSQAPPKLPNNQSESTIETLGIPGTEVPRLSLDYDAAWNPTISPFNLCTSIWPSSEWWGPRECSDFRNRTYGNEPEHQSFSSVMQISDSCRRTIPVRGDTGLVRDCKDGGRAMDDTWKSWGADQGWRLPTVNELTKLATAGSFSDISLAATGVNCDDDVAPAIQNASATLAKVFTVWCGRTKFWASDTAETGTEWSSKYNTGDTANTYVCSGLWSNHKYVDLSDGKATIVGPPDAAASGGLSSQFFYRDFYSQGTPEEVCAYQGLLEDGPYGGMFPDPNAKMKGQGVWPMSARPLTTSKGDDYMAQNAMGNKWPVIAPTGPSNLYAFFPPGSDALVGWQFPASDGGAPISSYKVTASPAAGGTAKDCPIIYRQTDGYEAFQAKCSGLSTGTRYSFEVTAINSELLSGSATIIGQAEVPATPDTTPATSPTTATPDTTPATSPTTPTPETTPSTAVTVPARDVSQNVEAESFDGQCADCSGVTIKANDGFTSGGYIGAISTGDWVRFEGVNTPVGSDATFAVQVASGATTAGTIELHADSPTGALLASVPVPNTGGWHTWTTLTADKQLTTRMKPVYLVFKSGQSGDFVNVDWFKFTA